MDIKGMLLNKNTIGGSLVLVGIATVFGANFRIMNRVLVSPPVLGDITLMRVMGGITTLLGVAVLTGIDPLSLEKEV
jgi:hypothetical protein